MCFVKIDFHEFLLESGNTKFMLISFSFIFKYVQNCHWLILHALSTTLNFCEKGPDGSCQNNWFSIIGANGGMQVVPSMCGERRGQSSKIES